MDRTEREFALQHLADSRERLIQIIAGLTSEQHHFRPADDRWSVADCIEHITVVERNIFRSLQRVIQTEPQPEKQAEAQGKDRAILERVPARANRVTGPPEVMPCGRWPRFEELLRQFEASRERTLRFAAVTQADLRNHFFPHPILGLFDGYQWLLFLATHCERHVRQIEEVMAHPEFPGLPRQEEATV